MCFGIMCFVDSSASSLDMKSCEIDTNSYKCEDCGSRFKALGAKISCPSCESIKVKKM